MTPDLLGRVLAPQPPAFALLYRPETTGREVLEVLVGEVSTPDTLAGIPLSARPGAPGHEVLTIIPYRQITERGFACADDGAPLITMTVTGQEKVRLRDALERIPDSGIRTSDGHFDVDDDTYADTVRRVINDEIGRGEGANFVLKRSFTAKIVNYSPLRALTLFRRLLDRESSSYWTFIVHTGDRTFVGATPERHLSLRGGIAMMNPISGTYRYPLSGPKLPEVMEFLADPKEADELYMVVDEELKMMARVCDTDIRVMGPYLKEMARLAHTEYFIEGHSTRDPCEILRETMFAPTVTGSPLESACRVIDRYEPRGRGYYSGIVALMGHDENGDRTLDSSILIRTAEIDSDSRMRIGVGATVVRHSEPASEVAETQAKAAGLLAALDVDRPVTLSAHPDVRAALAERNTTIAGFWLDEGAARARPEPALADMKVLVVDMEDTFTSMLAHQLRCLDLSVTVRRFDEPYTFDEHDLVVLGPGPGDPRATGQPRIDHVRSAVRALLAERRPFLAVCLSHQVLSMQLGFALGRRDVPNQGVQHQIDLFGVRERVGFYNSFVAHSGEDEIERAGVGTVEVSRNADTGEIHALRGPHFASIQFHAESLLTHNGINIIGGVIKETLDRKDRELTDTGRSGLSLLL